MEISRRTLFAGLPLSALTLSQNLLQPFLPLSRNSSRENDPSKVCSGFRVKTAVKVSEVQLYLDNSCSEAHVEGVCALDGFSSGPVPCTLYFPLERAEDLDPFLRFCEVFQKEALYWVDATDFLVERDRDGAVTFTTFSAEPVAPAQAAALASLFASKC